MTRTVGQSSQLCPRHFALKYKLCTYRIETVAYPHSHDIIMITVTMTIKTLINDSTTFSCVDRFADNFVHSWYWEIHLDDFNLACVLLSNWSIYHDPVWTANCAYRWKLFKRSSWICGVPSLGYKLLGTYLCLECRYRKYGLWLNQNFSFLQCQWNDK